MSEFADRFELATTFPNASGLSVAVTGHQPPMLGGYGRDVASRLKALAAAWLSVARPREVVSGMAAGWDEAVAEAAIDLGIPLVAALAFKDQCAQWPQDALERHKRLLMRASETYVYSEGKAHGCWTRRDRWVIERGDVVLALWSGVDSGTGRAVKAAANLGRPVFNVWDAWVNSVPRRDLGSPDLTDRLIPGR